MIKKGGISICGLMLFALVVNSCKKDTPTTPITKTIIEHDTIKYAWLPEPEFYNGDQDISMAYAANGKVLFYGTQYNYYIYDSISNGWGAVGAVTQLSNRMPAVNKTFFAIEDLNNNFIIVNPYVSSQPSYATTFKNFDTNFVSFPLGLVNYQLSGSVGISDSNRILFPVRTNDQTKNYFYLLDAKFNQNNNQITISNFHKITLGSYIGVTYLINTTQFKNRFFVGSGDTTYLVREDYSSKPIAHEVFIGTFLYNGSCYAIGSATGTVYASNDNGENWSPKYTLNNPSTVIINFDNKLIAIVGGQLWEVTLTPTNISFKEINNDGIAGKTISGIVKCNNKVWITTNGGVFYRPYSNFYQYK